MLQFQASQGAARPNRFIMYQSLRWHAWLKPGAWGCQTD